MKIEILRGKEHIGGNIIKVTEGDTGILLDCGAKLPAIGEPSAPDDFDMGKIGKVAALFLSHHHGDHSGLMEKLPGDVDLYATPETVAFMDPLDMYLDRPLRTRGRAVHGLTDGACVGIGPLLVTAWYTRHSAEGAAMFLVEGGGKTLLYTGDYKHPVSVTKGVDLLITEGTMLTRDDQAYPDEKAVEAAFRKVLRETEGRVFVLASSANLPRIQSVMNACAQEPGRPVMQDLFLKYLLESTGHPRLAAPYGFIYHRFAPKNLSAYHRIATHYRDIDEAASCRRIMDFPRALVFIRPSMADKLEKLIRGGMDISRDALVFSLWRGYERNPETARLVELFAENGVKPQYIHTSGHADRRNIQELIQNVRPKRIACIHSENAALIAELAEGIPVETGSVIEL